jgi:hypothetical protein
VEKEGENMLGYKMFGLTLAFALMAIMFFALVVFVKQDDKLKRAIKKFALNSILFVLVCVAALFGMMSYFTPFSEYLSDIIRPEHIQSLRLVLRMVFGTESVFSSIQLMISLLLVALSLLSGLFCVFAIGGNVRIFINKSYLKKEEKHYTKTAQSDYFAFCNLPVLYSRIIS